jgi:hypothetical protein
MNASSGWPRNRLLLALPSRNLKRLMPELEQIRCHRAQVLMNADSSLDHVFFPDSGVVSVVAVYASGSIIEMATITLRQLKLHAEAKAVQNCSHLRGPADCAAQQRYPQVTKYKNLIFDLRLVVQNDIQQ